MNTFYWYRQPVVMIGVNGCEINNIIQNFTIRNNLFMSVDRI